MRGSFAPGLRLVLFGVLAATPASAQGRTTVAVNLKMTASVDDWGPQNRAHREVWRAAVGESIEELLGEHYPSLKGDGISESAAGPGRAVLDVYLNEDEEERPGVVATRAYLELRFDANQFTYPERPGAFESEWPQADLDLTLISKEDTGGEIDPLKLRFNDEINNRFPFPGELEERYEEWEPLRHRILARINEAIVGAEFQHGVMRGIVSWIPLDLDLATFYGLGGKQFVQMELTSTRGLQQYSRIALYCKTEQAHPVIPNRMVPKTSWHLALYATHHDKEGSELFLSDPETGSFALVDQMTVGQDLNQEKDWIADAEFLHLTPLGSLWETVGGNAETAEAEGQGFALELARDDAEIPSVSIRWIPERSGDQNTSEPPIQAFFAYVTHHDPADGFLRNLAVKPSDSNLN